MTDYFSAVVLADRLTALEPLAKEGRLYVAPLAAGALRVQTPPTQVLVLEDNFAFISPTGPFAAFLRQTEAALKESCAAHAASWGISEDQVAHSFKSFFREDGTFKVRVDPDFAAFDEHGDPMDRAPAVPAHARAILELSKVCLGKTEMGAMWRLLQLRVAPQPVPCLIDLEVEVPDDADLADHDPATATEDETEFV